MPFDPNQHKKRQDLIQHGRNLSPNEKNLTTLYNLACKDLGIKMEPLSSTTANHLPTPEESARQDPKSPACTECPACGKRSYFMMGLCPTCKEAESGKYKTKFECFECHYSTKSELSTVVWLQRWKIDFTLQTKTSLGIKTITDDGIK